MRIVTLVFLIKGDRVLLGLKKVRFGAGHLNGYGGGVEDGETIEEAAVREVREEAGITINAQNLTKVALMHFRFPEKPEFAHDVHTYIVREFEGEAIETEEMSPGWYPLKNLPLEQMWPSDPYWVPLILLEKKTIEGTCEFKGEQKPFTVKNFEYREVQF